MPGSAIQRQVLVSPVLYFPMYLIHHYNYTSPRLLAILLQNNSKFHVYYERALEKSWRIPINLFKTLGIPRSVFISADLIPVLHPPFQYYLWGPRTPCSAYALQL